MFQTRTDALRRVADPAYLKYFSGIGLDIQNQVDALVDYAPLFPNIQKKIHVGLEEDIDPVFVIDNESFDFVYASYVLCSVKDIFYVMTTLWRALKPGGYLIATLPSGSDQENRVCVKKPLMHWTLEPLPLDKAVAVAPHLDGSELPTWSVFELIEGFCALLQVERVTLTAEDSIELVLRKKEGVLYPVWLDMAAQLEARRDVSGAQYAYQQALKLAPEQFDLYKRYAFLLNLARRYDEALKVWEKGVAQLGHLHEAHLYHALHLICMGNLQQGFALRDRLVCDERRTPITPPQNYPRWSGQSLENKSIVIWTEFGLGDEIFFLRFAKLFLECGAARVSVVCQKPLKRIFQSCAGVDIYDSDEVDTLSQHDYWVFPHSILVYLPLQLQALPHRVPYLSVPPSNLVKKGFSIHKILEKMRKGVQSSDGFSSIDQTLNQVFDGIPKSAKKIGIVFKGSPNHENDQARSLSDLQLLRPILEIKGAHFFSLQKGAGESETENYSKTVGNFTHLGGLAEDFFHSGQILSKLDLLITVDTSMAHLAGAMGLPVWIMLPSVEDWRWHFGYDQSPWYPSMKLYRQNWHGDWSGPIEAMQKNLQQMLRAKDCEAAVM